MLDEATSALDSETEQKIQEALNILSASRTVPRRLESRSEIPTGCLTCANLRSLPLRIAWAPSGAMMRFASCRVERLYHVGICKLAVGVGVQRCKHWHDKGGWVGLEKYHEISMICEDLIDLVWLNCRCSKMFQGNEPCDAVDFLGRARQPRNLAERGEELQWHVEETSRGDYGRSREPWGVLGVEATSTNTSRYTEPAFHKRLGRS